MSGAIAAWDSLLEELARQRSFMDLFVQAWSAEYRSSRGMIHCRKGCCGCCSLAVNCTLTEALAITGSLDERQGRAVAEYARSLRDKSAGIGGLREYLRLHRREMGGCPLLDENGACGMYALRPLSCRALLSTKESSWCVVDFSELSPEAKQSYLESLDQAVTAFPLHYVAATRDTAQELEARGLELMRDTFGFSLYGSLPVLLHLVREHGLSHATGTEHARRVLRESGFDHPLMTDLRERQMEGEV